jgi:hypothetical protein
MPYTPVYQKQRAVYKNGLFSVQPNEGHVLSVVDLTHTMRPFSNEW